MLYHVTTWPQKAGDIKPAGTYWAGLVTSGQSLLNDEDGEFIREQVRAQHFPGLPSRQRSSFAFENYDDARLFLPFRPGATIYQVQFVNPSAPTHRVTWSAFDAKRGAPVLIQAREFWSGQLLYSSNIEIFAESDLLFL